MKVILKSGTTEYILANGPARGLNLHVGPANIRLGSETAVQVLRVINGTWTRPKKRDNFTTTFSFDVVTERGTDTAAADYAVQYPTLHVLREGLIKVVTTEPNNQQYVQYIHDCVLRSIVTSVTGRTVHIHYEIIGGLVNYNE